MNEREIVLRRFMVISNFQTVLEKNEWSSFIYNLGCGIATVHQVGRTFTFYAFLQQN